MHTPVTIIGTGLGTALAAHPDDVETALTEYEQAVSVRGTEAVVLEGAEVVQGIDSEDNTARAVLRMITGQGQ